MEINLHNSPLSETMQLFQQSELVCLEHVPGHNTVSKDQYWVSAPADFSPSTIYSKDVRINCLALVTCSARPLVSMTT